MEYLWNSWKWWANQYKIQIMWGLLCFHRLYLPYLQALVLPQPCGRSDVIFIQLDIRGFCNPNKPVQKAIIHFTYLFLFFVFHLREERYMFTHWSCFNIISVYCIRHIFRESGATHEINNARKNIYLRSRRNECNLHTQCHVQGAWYY